MSNQLPALAVALDDHKDTIFSRWHAVVSELPGAANLDGREVRDHIPQFIDEMILAIARREKEVDENSTGSPVEHGTQRLAAGFDIKEVVKEYNALRGAVYDVAEKTGIQLSANDCRVINRIIDEAIASAVDTFAREQATELQRRREEHFAFIAHDVRTPLNAIALTAEVLAEDLGESSYECVDMVRALQRNVQRIEELIRHVMEKAHYLEPLEGMSLNRREMDLWPLVHRLIQDLKPVTEAARVRMRNLVPRHLTLNADAGLLVRTLQNLVTNAVKFAPGGEIEIGAKETPDGVECWVSDNGDGIAPDRLGRIFEKGETDNDPTRAGSGLGLTICKQIVEAHGGEISAESRPSRGATFRFTLPAPAPGAG